MITLASGSLYGIADYSNCIAYTITGLELSGSLEDYKVLAQGQLSSSASIIYTVPANRYTFIKEMFFSSNTGTLIPGVKLFMGGSGSINQIVNLAIQPNGSAKFDSTGWQVYDFLGVAVKDLSLTTLYDDISGTVAFVGSALPGVATSSAQWRISKINTTSGVVMTWADGDSNFDNIWQNRHSLSYS